MKDNRIKTWNTAGGKILSKVNGYIEIFKIKERCFWIRHTVLLYLCRVTVLQPACIVANTTPDLGHCSCPITFGQKSKPVLFYLGWLSLCLFVVCWHTIAGLFFI